MLVNVLFPINADTFTYKVPDEFLKRIKKGCRVRAPFKRGEKTGVVTDIMDDSDNGMLLSLGDSRVRLREIIDVADDDLLIPDKLIQLIKWVAEYYISSSGTVLKYAVPSSFFTGRETGRQRITHEFPAREEISYELTSEQSKAVESIVKSKERVFLLHGVTGSGKTEVYINAIKSLPHGKSAIVLVPEIAITTQMIDRFYMAFGDDVAIYHSGLSAGERIRQWKRMLRGEAKVVVGVRSAVFAPFDNTGLIVIDEEQESSYKQFEGLRYNARDVALARSQIEKVRIVLGSATPSIEVYYNANRGKFRYLPLMHRIDRKPLPQVEIIDMSRADKETFSFSTKLVSELRTNKSHGHQSLLMLNRRGYSPFYMCTDCGYVHKCPACSITLIFHKDKNTLNCHYCNSFLEPPGTCPNCKGSRVKYLGTGTQRIEEELLSILPGIVLQRMDRDSTRRKLSHFRIVRKMEQRKIDVLLGTQMVAKGHDFPDVTVSAVVLADVALNLPDFRSAERAFQLFTQLAGRSGRGKIPGHTFIQTYDPEHYVFEYVKRHDYTGFYEKEIALRKELGYPPFNRLTRIIFSFRSKESAESVISVLKNGLKRIEQENISILGPAPAPMEKIKSFYRWHLILKGKNAKVMRSIARDIIDVIRNKKGVRIDVDVDPVNMM